MGWTFQALNKSTTVCARDMRVLSFEGIISQTECNGRWRNTKAVHYAHQLHACKSEKYRRQKLSKASKLIVSFHVVWMLRTKIKVTDIKMSNSSTNKTMQPALAMSLFLRVRSLPCIDINDKLFNNIT